MNRVQRQRLLWRTGFFALFLLAPPLDIFRYDLTLGHFILFAHPWTLGIDADNATQIGRQSHPARLSAGRDPRGSGDLGVVALRPSLLRLAVSAFLGGGNDQCPDAPRLGQADAVGEAAAAAPSARRGAGRTATPFTGGWSPSPWCFSPCSGRSPCSPTCCRPAEVWGNLLQRHLTRNQALFLGVATGLLTIEFSLARHLFCRFGCAIGLFQSLVWMANRRALVVGFDRRRALVCAGCDRPANTPARCACGRARSSAGCSPAPSASNASRPVTASTCRRDSPACCAWCPAAARKRRPSATRALRRAARDCFRKDRRAMEEQIGQLWHRLVTRAARRDYPEAAVSLSEVQPAAAMMFRALGGTRGLRVEAATETRHGARRGLLERIAGTARHVELAWRDEETLRLPARIAAFPDRALNRELYLWLAALAAGGADARATGCSAMPPRPRSAAALSRTGRTLPPTGAGAPPPASPAGQPQAG